MWHPGCHSYLPHLSLGTDLPIRSKGRMNSWSGWGSTVWAGDSNLGPRIRNKAKWKERGARHKHWRRGENERNQGEEVRDVMSLRNLESSPLTRSLIDSTPWPHTVRHLNWQGTQPCCNESLPLASFSQQGWDQDSWKGGRVWQGMARSWERRRGVRDRQGLEMKRMGRTAGVEGVMWARLCEKVKVR